MSSVVDVSHAWTRHCYQCGARHSNALLLLCPLHFSSTQETATLVPLADNAILRSPKRG